MTNPVESGDPIEFSPTVHFVDTHINTNMKEAWRRLIDYESWNPSFMGAKVIRERGEPYCERELVLFTELNQKGVENPFPEYYADTVRLIPGSRVIWYCYPKEGQTYHGQHDAFRNFVDFHIIAEGDGVRFIISYYAQRRLTGEALSQEVAVFENGLPKLAAAFKDFCEQSAA